MKTLLEVSHLAAGYDAIRIVNNISLQVAAGSVVALIGGNGAGKTTLVRSIAGSLPIQSGDVTFGGVDVTGLPASQRVELGLALVPEGRLIFPRMTVEQNLRVGAIAPHARPRTRANIERMYAMFPRLLERRHQLGGTLSGGEQQMLAISRGLMAEPRLLVLDEPTLGLAPLAADFIFESIAALRTQGLTILIAEQDVARTLELADNAYVIENGMVVLTGTGTSLLKDSRVRSAYLGI
jgi:branched-chain amino acid transport system ATP-binding protein